MSAAAVIAAPSAAATLPRMLVTAFLEHVPDYVYFKDRASRYLAVSQSLVRYLGAARKSDVIGHTDFDFFQAPQARSTSEQEQRIIGSGEAVLGQLERDCLLNGSEHWVVSNKIPLRNASGETIGTFGIRQDVTETKRMEQALQRAHREFVDASRAAGMTEIANGVLHNVGNVLNSLNVAASVVSNGIRASKVDSLAKTAALLRAESDRLAEFLTHDPKGRRIPEFIASLARHAVAERDRLLQEVKSLQQNIDHVKEIVAMQQHYATSGTFVEPLEATALVEDAVRIANLAHRPDLRLVREFAAVPPVQAEKAKVVQILVNLLRNAKYACDESGKPDKEVRVLIRPGATAATVVLAVQDNGVGIPPENLTRIFGHGFTTRANGHGFGLHSAANGAHEMKGTLTVHSDGRGRGATFTLELPATSR